MVRVAITILVSVLMASTAHAKRVALVVGINKYDNLSRDRQLAKAVNDARAMEAALKAVGFDVIKAEDVGRPGFNQAWQQLLNKLAPGDEVAVFFSGHGVEIEGGNYLVPRDVPAVGTGEARRLKNESLSFDELRRDLAAHGPRLSLFIIDACRDNPFTDTRGRSIGGAKGLVPVQAEYGTFIMFAAGTRESALDRLGDADRDPNSIYTRKLLPLLKQPGLRLPDMAQRVRGEVRQLANTVGHRQSPAYYDEGADDVCLAGCTQVSEAERAWRWVNDSTNQSVLENFIKEFGDTTFGVEAKAQLAELKKQQVIAKPPPSVEPTPTKPIERPASNAPAPVAAATPPPAAKPAPPSSSRPSEADEAPGVKPPRPSPTISMEPAVGTFSRGRPAQPLTAADVAAISPKDSFKECDVCPEMAVVPAGEFMMGSPADEEGRNENEGPVRKVTIRKTLAVGKFEVTRGEFAVFVRASGGKGPDDCRTWTGREWKQQVDKNWASPGFEQTDRHPVTCVSWDDASAFAKWLTDKTGKQYRLLSEAEWEYAARAGTITAFSTGPTITTDQANFDGNYTYAGSAKGAARGKTLAVGSLMPNAFGLYDMHGNVWEWVADCYESTYLNAPRNGSARVSSSCEARVLRGGSWFHWPRNARSADRIRYQPSIRYNYLGFRVARTL